MHSDPIKNKRLDGKSGADGEKRTLETETVPSFVKISCEERADM